MKLSVIIPAYNEQYTIRECVNRILAAKLPRDISKEIIIVDDHSTDGTWEIIKDIARSHKEIKLAPFGRPLLNLPENPHRKNENSYA
ncbi:glycosyltransferase, partial [bacterium]|nr:glycosyltransferase [bacterium]